MSRPIRIRGVEALHGYVVRLELTDGTMKTVDLERFLRGPVFEQVRSDPAFFRRIAVDARAGTIVWPNGADVDPDVLCQDLPPAWQSEEATSHRA